MSATFDSDAGQQRGWQANDLAHHPQWLKLTSSPVTTPGPSKSTDAIDIPSGPPSTASSSDGSTASSSEASTIPSDEDAEEDPWQALRSQLQTAIAPLVEEGNDQIEAFEYHNDMLKRLEHNW